MSDIATLPATTLPARIDPVPMSAALRWLVESEPAAWRVPSSGDITEAKRLLDAAERLCEPPSRADPAWQQAVVAWLGRIAAGVRNPPATRADMMARAAAVMAACADLPRAVWTDDTAAAALALMSWWPAAADVHAFLNDRARVLLLERDGLRRVAGTVAEGPKPAVAEPPDPVRIAEIAARAKADLDAMNKPAERHAARPSRITRTLAELDEQARAGNGEARREAGLLRARLREASAPVVRVST